MTGVEEVVIGAAISIFLFMLERAYHYYKGKKAANSDLNEQAEVVDDHGLHHTESSASVASVASTVQSCDEMRVNTDGSISYVNPVFTPEIEPEKAAAHSAAKSAAMWLYKGAKNVLRHASGGKKHKDAAAEDNTTLEELEAELLQAEELIVSLTDHPAAQEALALRKKCIEEQIKKMKLAEADAHDDCYVEMLPHEEEQDDVVSSAAEEPESEYETEPEEEEVEVFDPIAAALQAGHNPFAQHESFGCGVHDNVLGGYKNLVEVT